MNELDQRNIKLIVAYDGTAYHGWQRQAAGIDTVQQRLEEAAESVLRHRVVVHGAGRTDAGVHAEGQAGNFGTPMRNIPLEGLRRAINSRLPADIAVRSACEVPDGFHASRSAVGKTYRYRIFTRRLRDVTRVRYVWNCYHALDPARMAEGARRLIGTHDVRGLATSSDPRENTVRTIFRCEVSDHDDEIHVRVQGDGFLYNMVRIIVGTLAEIGRGHWPPERIDEILATGDRRLAGPTAPPEGLAMLCVHYDRRELTLPG